MVRIVGLLALASIVACSNSASPGGAADAATRPDVTVAGYDAAPPPDAAREGGDAGPTLEASVDAQGGCTSNDQCPVGTSCFDSVCFTVGCGPLAPGGGNGTYGGPCRTSGGDASDGMCLPVDSLGTGSSPDCQFGWVCIPAGTSTTTCLPSTDAGMNPPASAACALGTACYSVTGVTGTCVTNCGPIDGGACPPQGLATCMSDAGDAASEGGAADATGGD